MAASSLRCSPPPKGASSSSSSSSRLEIGSKLLSLLLLLNWMISKAAVGGCEETEGCVRS